VGCAIAVRLNVFLSGLVKHMIVIVPAHDKLAHFDYELSHLSWIFSIQIVEKIDKLLFILFFE
jgi:hypothetical protein